jgi:undecaprenyl diphosphate synthase
VAIIMDGNRRWARARGLPAIAGHVQGVEAIKPIVRVAPDLGVEVLSLYVFSLENQRRPDDEVTGLYGLIDGAVRQNTDELIEQGVRVRVIGRLHEAPSDVQRSIRAAEERTSAGRRMTLNICFNYSGRAEIIDATRALIASGIGATAVDEQTFARHLYTAGQPDPLQPLHRGLNGAARQVQPIGEPRGHADLAQLRCADGVVGITGRHDEGDEERVVRVPAEHVQADLQPDMDADDGEGIDDGAAERQDGELLGQVGRVFLLGHGHRVRS